MKILIVDNNDSFTYNLEHWVVSTSGVVPTIVRYDAFDPKMIQDYNLLIISAGPGHPYEYPKYRDALLLTKAIPTLGICLGMQIVNYIFGGKVSSLPGCIHGRQDSCIYGRHGSRVARYHSLSLEAVAPGFEVIMRNPQGIAMTIKHKRRPILGYQFHPESFLTQDSKAFFDYAYTQLIEDRSAAALARTC